MVPKPEKTGLTQSRRAYYYIQGRFDQPKTAGAERHNAQLPAEEERKNFSVPLSLGRGIFFLLR